MGYLLGVDMGTTFSAAGLARDGRVEIVGLGHHAAVVPSVLFLREDGTFLVGEAAARRGVSEPGRVARGFKRRFGDSTPVLLGGSPFSADALTAHLLRHLVETVVEQEGSAPDAVAVTCPANWGPYKTELLAQALRVAGIGDAAVLSEPEAAAVFYASTERVEPGEVVAIYDLGGGTFDAAVLRKTERDFSLLGSPEGIERLGGIDFDEAVLAHVQRFLGDALSRLDPSDPATLAALSRLRNDCVEAKEALSADSDVSIPVLLPAVQTEIRLTRAEFESMIRPTLAETTAALQRALESAGVGAHELKAVLLVGGSSRIPLVGQLVSAELGRPVALDVHPKHAVAQGAALAAGRRLGAVDPMPPRARVAPVPEAVGAGEAAPPGRPRPSAAAAPAPGRPVPMGTAAEAPSASPPSPLSPPSPRSPLRWRRTALVAAVVAIVVLAGAVFLLVRPSGKKAGVVHTPAVPTYNIQPDGISIVAGGTSLWLGVKGDSAVSRFDPVGHQVTQTIRLGSATGDTWVDYGGGSVWAVNDGETEAYRVDPATNTVVSTYQVGRQPRGILFAAGAVWAASSMDGVVTRIDPGTGATTPIHLRGHPTHLAFSHGVIWATDPANSSIARIDAATNVALADAASGGCPDYIAADETAVWVQDECKVTTVFRVDPATGNLTGMAKVGRDAKGLTVFQGRVYVAAATDANVTVVDESTSIVARTVAVGNGADAVAVDGSTAWVLNSSDTTISMVSL